MNQESQYAVRTTEGKTSRRAVLGALSAAVLGMLSSSALGAERSGGRNARAADATRTERMRRMEESRALAQRLEDADLDERMQIMRERMVARHREAIEDLKQQLGCSDAEWPVIKPRLETVYHLVHPLPQVGGRDASSRSELDQRTQELREVLADKGTDVEQIKAKLTALRTAKEKSNQKVAAARQSLRQLLTIRQEATLVVNGLLD